MAIHQWSLKLRVAWGNHRTVIREMLDGELVMPAPLPGKFWCVQVVIEAAPEEQCDVTFYFTDDESKRLAFAGLGWDKP